MSLRIALLVALAGLAATSVLAQSGQPASDRPRQGDRIARGGESRTDDAVQKLKASVVATDEQWSLIEARFQTLRQAQHEAMQEIHRSVMGAAEPTEQSERPEPPTPVQLKAMEKLIAEKVEPLNAAFLSDVRGTLKAEQLASFDAAVKGLDLTPRRGPQSGQGGPGGVAGARPEEFRQGKAVNGPLPPHQVTIEVKDGYRFITSNGIPDHKPGQFPGRGNPNTISAQHNAFRVTTSPKANNRAMEQRGTLAGIALNGVLFDPGTAEAWKDDPSTGWRMEAISPSTVSRDMMGLDESNAHVQPTGAYHYHAAPEGLIELLCKAKGVKDGEAMLLIGWAADGFPIYDHHAFSNADDASSPIKEVHSSYRLKAGTRPNESATPPGPGGAFDGTYTQDFEYVKGSGDLDECNGRFGVTPEFPEGTYYYVISGEFPFVSRSFRGTPDDTFTRKGPPPGVGGRPGGKDRQGAQRTMDR